MKRYFEDFRTVADVIGCFCIPDDFDLKDEEVLYASYSREDYEGSAVVLFLREGKLYEVYGSHCSCYGLEDQWEPEEASIMEIIRRFGSYANSDELLDFLRDLLGN